MGKNIEEEFEDDDIQTDLKGKVDVDLMKILLLLKTEMKLMRKEMKKDIGEVMKFATGKRGDELDKEKYKMLVSEYRKFKTKNVKHFRFNSADNLSPFGKDELVQ